jgi:hypothetical protein
MDHCPMKRILTLLIISSLITIILAACAPQTPPPPDPTLVSAIVDATLRAVPTSTPYPTFTPEIPTAVPATPVPPTPTPLPNDPLAILGKPDGSDSFNTSQNWAAFNNDCYQSSVANGQFVMNAKGLPNLVCWQHSWPKVENFYLDSKVINPLACQPSDRYGLYLRGANETQGYIYGLDCSGQYFLWKIDGANATPIIPYASSTSIAQTPGKTNILGIAVNGSTFQLYANGTFLASGMDDSFTAPGYIGFFVDAAPSSGTPYTVYFDDLRVWLLPRPQ